MKLNKELLGHGFIIITKNENVYEIYSSDKYALDEEKTRKLIFELIYNKDKCILHTKSDNGYIRSLSMFLLKGGNLDICDYTLIKRERDSFITENKLHIHPPMDIWEE
jgi:hypothetical protein